MATDKPRITITLEPRAYEVVRRLSAANGSSMSALVAGFLDVAVPPMERLVVLLEQAAAMPEATRAEVRDSVLRAEAKLFPHLARQAEQLDFLTEEASLDIELAAARSEPGGKASPVRLRSAGEAAKRPPTPVPVTRGSGPRSGGAGKANGRAARGRV